MKSFLIIPIIICSLSATPALADTAMPEVWEQCARLAQNGDAEAQYRLAVMYREGRIVGENQAEAFYWFRKSASNGNGDAMYEVGRCFRDGLGVIADNRIAAENFWRAAERGNPEGAYCYAEMLRDGKGVPQDKGKAYKWFSKAAEKGYADAERQAHLLSSYAKVSKGTAHQKTSSLRHKNDGKVKNATSKHRQHRGRPKQKRK
ncbi:MAG: sel1 repeat family protein [Muribaculaceae bacterium]|nr:sel1 repeat family protein [Muribaculaceae bacterium]